MIQQLSTNMGSNLARQLGYEKPQAEIFAYSFQVLLETFIKIGLIITGAFLLDIGKPTVLVLFTYGVIRTFGGGVHLSTFTRCLTVGWTLIVGLGAISTVEIPVEWIWALFITALAGGIVSIIFWVPAGTEKKKITDVQVRKKQKIRTSVVLFIWAAAVLCLFSFEQYPYTRAIIYGALGALLLISPVGYGLLSAFDNSLDFVLKGGVEND